VKNAVLIIAAFLLLLVGCPNPHHPSEPHIQKTILFNPRAFTTSQIDAIHSAAREWETKTNFIVRFDIHDYHDQPLQVNEVAIFNVPLDFPVITAREIELHQNGMPSTEHILGLYKDRIIYTISAKMPGLGSYRPVIIHELGHMLGLNHINDAYSVMNESFDRAADHITVADQVLFCKLYGCDPVRLSMGD